jgi:hypothetical protein
VDRTRAWLGNNGRIDWLNPPELEPVSHVSPLCARDTLQRWVVAAGSVLLVLVPVAAFLLVRQLGH